MSGVGVAGVGMSLDHCLARAAEAHAEAEATKLQNVRDRCLRSEAIWREMAARVEQTDAMRRSRDNVSAGPAASAFT